MMSNIQTGRAAVLAALLLFLLLTVTACAGRGAPAEREESDGEASGMEMSEAEHIEEERETAFDCFTLGYYSKLGLNPYTCNNETNQALIHLLYEPLFQVTPTFDTEACLAQSCVQDGEGRWTLTLRPGVSFWNGEKLTAADVIDSLTEAAGEDSLYAQRLAPMSDLRQEEDGTVSFLWSEPLGDLTPLLEIPIVQSGTARDDLPIGTGGYLPQLEEETLDALSVYPGWWQGEAMPVEKIALQPVYDEDTLVYGFESGQITLVSSSLTASNSLGYAGSYEVWDYPTSYLLYLGCNTAGGICAGRDFRLALQSALDRETIAQSLFSGHAASSPLPFPPGTAYYDDALAQSLSGQETKALSQFAGERVTILVNAESAFKTTAAQFVADGLRAAGLEAEVSALPWTAFQQALAGGDYDLYLGEVKLQANFDLSPFFDLDGSLNFSRFAADEITAALADYQSAGSGERPARAKALSQAICQEAPILPLCFEEHSILYHWGSLERCTATQSNLLYHFQEWSVEYSQDK